MSGNDERDPWSKIQAMLHPASGAPAVLCTLALAADGQFDLTGAGCRVGLVSINVEPAVNDSPWPELTQPPTEQL